MKKIALIVAIAGIFVLQAQAQCLSGDCTNGRGHMRYPDGSEYQGHFKEKMAHGLGECIYARGANYRYQRYKGSWENNQFHGYGVAITAQGDTLRGHWENNDFKGSAISHNPIAASPSPAINPSKYALIIGVSQYLHYPSLKLADNDAYRFEAFLRSLPGGALRESDIILLIDAEANYQNIRKALHDLSRKAQSAGEMLIIYYSGHGEKEGWLAYDSYGEPNDIITYDEINRILAASPAQHKLYLADACYSGSAFKGIQSDQGAHQSLQSNNVTMITSSKADEKSSEDLKLSNGVFTYYLLKGLEDGAADANQDDIITDYELMRYLERTIPQATKQQQTPQFYTPTGRTAQIILSTLN